MPLLAHKILLRPNQKQIEFFEQSVGCRRFVWNMCLSEWNYAYKHGLRPDKFYMRFYLRCLKEKYQWLRDISDAPLQEAINDLCVAFERFFKKTGKYPRFKRKGVRDSFSIRNTPKFKIDGRYLEIEKLRGFCIPMQEKVRFDGQARQITISKTAGRWFVSVLMKVPANPFTNKMPSSESQAVGVDLGVKELAVLSNGEVYGANQPLKRLLKKLAKLQRKLAKKMKGSNRYKRLKAQIAELHYYITCKRNAVLHGITDYLTKTFKKIVIEDLNVKGMVKNHCLARAISDCGFGEFRRQLEYKSELRGNNLVVADRWFPSSKMCSKCGSLKKDLTLADRMYKCTCGLSIDRDLNASINLMNYVAKDSKDTKNARKSTSVTKYVDDVNLATTIVLVA